MGAGLLTQLCGRQQRQVVLGGGGGAALGRDRGGAQTQQLGHLTFPIICRDVFDVLTASDVELVACMRFFAERMKMVVEPTGCLGFAAARRMKAELAGKRVGVIVSGGNVDLPRYAALLAT